MRAEEHPDKTVDELLEMEDDDPHSFTEEDLEQRREKYENLRLGITYMMEIVAVGGLFIHGQITQKEYAKYVERIEERANGAGAEIPM